ncbi:MAG: acyloxyacyl hydrolase, partial [Phocaeicola sp.]|nr:acyloxyacyl hydrolase [Phocaeicola sp.]
NWSYHFKTGFSVDGVYDASTDTYALDSAVGAKSSGYSTQFGYPPFSHKIALGLSGRMEYVMPYFSINLGIGANVLHKGKDLKGLYQVLALKVNMSRDTYLNVGYNLQNFKDPNYLMLGIGYRFHNLYPKIRKD